MVERIADLLVDANRYVEAAPLYRQLLLDPWALPSSSRDVVEAREAHARALFDCSRALGDLGSLKQSFEDLKHALARDDRQAGARTPTTVSPATLEALSAARQHLRARAASTSSIHSSDPPAAPSPRRGEGTRR